MYKRNKTQQMIGKRKSLKYFAEPNEALKHLSNREKPYRELTERERKIREERRRKINEMDFKEINSDVSTRISFKQKPCEES